MAEKDLSNPATIEEKTSGYAPSRAAAAPPPAAAINGSAHGAAASGEKVALPEQRQQPAAAPAEGGVDAYFSVYTTKEELQKFLEINREELDVNFAVLMEHLPKLMKERTGEFVLMKGGEMLGFFSSRIEAAAEGNRRFKDCVFSALEVCNKDLDFGMYPRL